MPAGWLEEHPMTQAALDEEAEEWNGLGMKLELRSYSEDRLRAAG
jgi:hypothetical protein